MAGIEESGQATADGQDAITTERDPGMAADGVAPEGEPPVEGPPSLDEALASLPAVEVSSGEAQPTLDAGSTAADEHAAPSSPDAALVEGVAGGLTWIPFALYLGAWVVLVGMTAYLLYDAAASQPARWMPEYVPLLWTGVGLTALGPVLSLAVWLVARTRRPAGARHGLFSSAMTRGAVVAFFGVVIWIATLYVLDVVASGGAL